MSEYRTVQPSELPLNEGVRLLESNGDGLIAIEKPTGLLSHPNTSKDVGRSVLLAGYDYDGEFFFWKDADGVECRVWLINRLDSPTSGVMLLGLNPAINTIVKQLFATHRVSKIYYALVRKVPPTSAGLWSDTLSKKLVNGKRVIKKAVRVPAKTKFQVVSKPTGGFPISLLRLSPITGRTHQLRVQCQKHGHPIVGDQTYGHFGFNKEVLLRTGHKRMMLHSAETVLRYAYEGKVCVFNAKSQLPEAFQEVLRYRPGISPVNTAKAVEEKAGSSLKGRRFKDAQ